MTHPLYAVDEHRASSMIKVPIICFLWSAIGFMSGALAQGGTPHQVSPDWTVDLRTVGAIAGIVLPATYWLARTITKINDRLDRMEELRKEHDDETNRSLHSLEAKINSLPCNHGNCPPQKKNR